MKLTKDEIIDYLTPILEDYEKGEVILKQILKNQEDANKWDRLNSAFRDPIDWRRIEYMSIKEDGKEPQVVRMG